MEQGPRISAQGASSSPSQGRRPWTAVNQWVFKAQRADRSKSQWNCRPVGPQIVSVGLVSRAEGPWLGELLARLGRKTTRRRAAQQVRKCDSWL